MAEIVNRVAQSKLVTFDLEDLYVEGPRMQLDIKAWLFEEIILKEKEFREQVENYDWQQYQNAFVALNCSSDAIIPGWAYMLVASKLEGFAKRTIVGELNDLESLLYKEQIDALTVSQYQDLPVIIKGCTNKPVPANAYIWVVQKIQQVAKSVMYGEACSSVPLYKRAKK